MINVMCDLETLGTIPGCKILSVGAVVFSPGGLGLEFYQEALIDHQGGLVADQNTIDWWKSQASEVRDRLFKQEAKSNLRHVLEDFNEWLRDQASTDAKGNLELCLWGNGADFDNAILQVAYEHVTVQKPAWKFWNNRCYRTLKSLAPVIKMDRQGAHHNALDDAKSQAAHAIKLMNFLQAW